MKKLANQIYTLEKQLKEIKNPLARSCIKNLIKKKRNQLNLLTPYHTK